MIELTPEQRQAVEHGEPVRVVDSTIPDALVVVRATVFESLTGEGREDEPMTPERLPIRQLVRDLPLPPQVAAEAEKHSRGVWFFRDRSRKELSEQMKMQHHYGGKWIAYLRTDDGPLVVAVADSLDESFDQQLAMLTDEERRTRIIDRPTKLFDEDSEILTNLTDEN